jgi:DNA-binding IclR family transcriptional regulator
MPRRALMPSVADEHAAPGGAAAVDRAIALLGTFTQGGGPFTLTTLAEQTKLYKSTVLRLLASLEHSGLVLKQPDGRYALGPMVAQLHASYAASFSLESVVMPVLRELVERTSESAAFHVRQGEHRLCLYRVDSPQPVRDHIKVGDLMPLKQGSGGRVLLAFAGVPGDLYARIRREQVAVMCGDRVPELAGVSSPVFDASGTLVGALTLTMPKERLLPAHAPNVLRAARGLTARLGGRFPTAART